MANLTISSCDAAFVIPVIQNQLDRTAELITEGKDSNGIFLYHVEHLARLIEDLKRQLAHAVPPKR
jgi:hypothetical protein